MQGDAAARPVLLDIREPDEYAEARIPGSVNLPRGLLEKHVSEIVGQQRPLVVCCQTGRRSALAADVLETMGYSAVSSLQGGLEAWRVAGRVVEGSPLGRQARRSAERAEPEAAAPSGTLSGEMAQAGQVDHGDWASIRADFGITSRLVRCLDGTQRPLVYLDHAASTHPPASIVTDFAAFLERDYANVHRATYALARQATDRFDEAFRTCAEFVGGNLEEGCVVFTGNTTQGCELVAHCVDHLPGKVMVTDLEHHSNDLPFRRRGEIVRARLTAEGRLDMQHVAELLRRERVKLVAVCGAANVTGWMPPIRELTRLAHGAGALISVDAAQLIAHIPVDVRAGDQAEGVDFLVAAGHKAYAPFGIGFVYGRRTLLDAAPPMLPGGGTARLVTEQSAEFMPSPDRHQGGTPNIAGAIAFAAMLRYLKCIGMERVRAHELALLRRAWSALRALPDLTLYGPDAIEERVGIVTFNIHGVSDMLAAAVLGEEFAVAVRNGRFCAHVHTANLLRTSGGFTADGETPPSAVRASVGLYSDLSDVDRLLEGVECLRARRWKGSYRMRAGAAVAERQWGGRCADAWMEGDGI
jgi:selenocysteine lyase/cysteine desulfurase/rhodanese-related sulfurtransferase